MADREGEFEWAIFAACVDALKAAVQIEAQDDGHATADGAGNGHVALALGALAEALACPAGPPAKPYVAALLKLAAGLSLDGASQVLNN